VTPSAVLLDASENGEYGGTGQTFDWKTAAEYRNLMPDVPPLVLSGGLTPENVAKAVENRPPCSR